MQKVKLVHWKEEEVEQRAAILCSAGYQVDLDLGSGSGLLKSLAAAPPAVVIIDLSRLPSQGRDLALLIRKRKGTRYLPLVFVGGDQQKVEGIKQLLPDANYTTWDQIKETLADAIAHPPQDPVVHDSTFAGYAGKPLVEKLGIKPGTRLALVNAPQDFQSRLDDLPPGVEILPGPGIDTGLTIWFCRSTKDLKRDIAGIVAQSRSGPVWIAWPKQAPPQSSDLTQQIVRRVGLANKLVDYKISALDETWSGLLFRYRGETE